VATNVKGKGGGVDIIDKDLRMGDKIDSRCWGRGTIKIVTQNGYKGTKDVRQREM
jgi:hypothetical protein